MMRRNMARAALQSCLTNVACCAGTRWGRLRQRVVWSLDWAWPHVEEMISVLTVTSLYRTVRHTLPEALRSWSAFRKATRCRLAP